LVKDMFDSKPNVAFIQFLQYARRYCINPELNCQEMNDTVLSTSIHQVSRLLGTDQELEPFYGMALKDPGLAPLTRRFRGLHIPRTVSVWEALVMAILGQQVSSHVSRMLRNLLVRTYGHSMNEEGTTYNTFPGPRSIAAAGEEGLWTIKLGKRKARYIVDIAAKVATGELDLEGLSALPDEEVLNILTNIRGVGLWTAGWLLIRGLCRPDAFPHEDLALRRTMALLFKDESLRLPEEALRFSRQWSPFRSFVTTYMFAAMRSGRLPSNS